MMPHVNYVQNLIIHVLVALFATIALSCQANVENNSVKPVSPPEVEIKPEIIAAPARDVADFSKQAASIPAQFSLKGPGSVRPHSANRIHIYSRLAGEMDIDIYRVVTGVIFLSAIGNFQSVVLPAEMRSALSMAHPVNNNSKAEETDHPTLGEFTWCLKFSHYLSGSEGEWQEYDIEVPDLPVGLYVIQVRLGPQVAHLPWLVTSMNAIRVCDSQKNWVWLINTDTGRAYSQFPFSHTREHSWQTRMTDHDAIATIPVVDSESWFFAYDDRDICVLPIAKGLKDKMDRSSLSIPQTLELSTYWLKSDVPVRFPMAITPTPVPDFPLRYIYLAQGRRAFAKDSQIHMTLFTSVDNAAVELRLLQHDEADIWSMVDCQKRICTNGIGIFFFPLTMVGWHKVACENVEVAFYVYNPTIPASHTLVERHCTEGQTDFLTLLIPGRNTAQWVVVSDKCGQLLQQKALAAFSGNQSIDFTLPVCGMSLQIRIYYWQKDHFIEEKWESQPAPQQPGVAWLPQSVTEGSTLAPVNFIDAFPTNTQFILCSLESPDKLERFSTTEFSRGEISANAVTLPDLYSKWRQEKLLAAYTQAFMTYGQKNLCLAMQACLQVLQLAPGDVQATNLLTTVLDEMNEGSQTSSTVQAPDILTRLQQKISLPIRGSMSIEELLQIISWQTGVYIELDPQAIAGMQEHLKLVDQISQGEPALSLLHYVLARLNWKYHIEHGTVYITANSGHTHSSLQEMDADVNDEMKLLSSNSDMENKSPANSEYLNRPICQPGHFPLLKFPISSVVCLRLIGIDEANQVHQKWYPVVVRK